MSNIIKRVKGNMSFENVLGFAMRKPGVKINRAKFLRKELQKYRRDDVIRRAINSNPAKAGIPRSLIDKIAKQVINYESAKVSGLSFVSSIPGGAAAVGAASADMISYFAFTLRTVQKLAYLYGFDQFDLNENDMDSESMHTVMLLIGVMFGVQGASSTLRKVADVLAKQVSKSLAKKALTKGAVYPVVKKVAANIGVRMTKQIFADGVASAVPFIGGAVSGGLTYLAFKPGCMKLRSNLRSYNLCNPDFYQRSYASPFKEAVDIDFAEIA